MKSPAETDKFSNWLIHRDGKCLVAGPCSVESEEQIRGTAAELAKRGVTLLRGRIWKPRTDTFLGTTTRLRQAAERFVERSKSKAAASEVCRVLSSPSGRFTN